jgi:hypothetical protein
MARDRRVTGLETLTVGIEQLSEVLILSRARINQFRHDGLWQLVSPGKHPLVKAVQAYIRLLRDRAIEGDSPGVASRTRLLGARADIAEYEAKRLAGFLVPADEVEKVWVEAVSRFRRRMLAIPTKAAPLLAVESEPDACQAIVEAAIHEALAELAATDVSVERQPRAPGTPKGSVRGSSTTAKADRLRVGRSGAPPIT